MMPKRVSLFCSSNDQISDMYFSEAEILGRGLAEMGVEIVFGGACLGVMGRIADTALAHGGKVIGVIPEYLNKKGIVHENLTELIVVSDFYDRKRVMLQGTEAVIAFPGGVGTLDEVTEVIALKQLGEYKAPIYFVNFLDSWQSLFDCLCELKERRMISQELESLYKSFPSSEELINSWLV
ncbi:MAG: TIGR00730 family Rossman fold protein [Bdellovibrionaceae bacterium]|nr:TIGR00730 family Rossman fold protein [Pseudobdellovibrionaceae bacterium]